MVILINEMSLRDIINMVPWKVGKSADFDCQFSVNLSSMSAVACHLTRVKKLLRNAGPLI